MPILSEFVLAPWRILALLGLGSINPTTGATDSAQGLCFSQNMEGQYIHVCNVLGYQMPSFIFWASLLIIILFVTSSASLLQQCSRVSKGLYRICRHLHHMGKNHHTGPLTPQDLQKIREIVSKEKLLIHPWELFEETLLVSQETKEVYSTCSIESILSKTLLIEENVHTAFFNAVPGVLTGMGLLMTFVAILDGLSHVSVAANMDVKGISGLINGLSGKFVSSIVAVSCAVSFVFVERIAYHKPGAAYRRLMTLLARQFRRRTTEHLLHSIHMQLAAQSGNVRKQSSG